MARVVCISGLALAGTAAPVRAGSWDLATQALVSGSYDDNIRLSSVSSTAAWTGVGDAGAQLQFRDDTFQFLFNPRVRAVRYAGERTLNRTEQYLTLQMQTGSERSATSMTLNGTQDTTLTSELGLTGFAETNKKHRVGAVTLSNSYKVTERIDVDAQAYASVNRYIDAERTGLIDYDYGSAFMRAGYDWSERTTISLQAAAGKLQVAGQEQFDKTSYSVTLGYAAQLAPRWRLDLSAGPSRVVARQRTDTGSVYDVTLTHTSEVSTMTLAVTRDVTPTGQGLLTRREQLRVGLDKSFTPRWSTSWSVAAIRNRNLLPSGELDRSAVTYGDVTANLTWLITPAWNISLSAGYTQQRVGTDQPLAERRHAGINVSWKGLARRLN